MSRDEAVAKILFEPLRPFITTTTAEVKAERPGLGLLGGAAAAAGRGAGRAGRAAAGTGARGAQPGEGQGGGEEGAGLRPGGRGEVVGVAGRPCGACAGGSRGV